MQRPPDGEEPSVDRGERLYLPASKATSWTARAEIMVGLGAIVGVLARYSIGEWSKQHLPGSYPTGTFVINLVGCLLIGIIQYLFLDLGTLQRPAQLFLAVGFCGGFTTFSTFTVETLRLIEADHAVLALGYQLFSLAGGLLAVACGICIAAFSVRVLGRNRHPT